MARKSIAVIGGGASGIMAAIAAANHGAQVTLYERNEQIGKKLLATGNGKCNFSNRQLSTDNYYGGDRNLISHILEQFDGDAVVAFFEDAGMLVKEKNGYLYPATQQAVTVLEILCMQLSKERVSIRLGQKVSRVIPDDVTDKLLIRVGKMEEIYDRVIITCGGYAAPKTGSDGTGCYLAKELGHKIEPVVPALVQLRCGENYMKEIAGVRADARIKLLVDGKEIASETGELQLTDYGISGIVVFQISRIAAYALQENKKVSVHINFLPDFTEEEFAIRMDKRLHNAQDDQTVEDFFTGMLNKKLLRLFIRLAGLKETEKYKFAEPKKLQKVFALCSQLPLTITATNSFDNAQTTAGGVSLLEVTSTLESMLHKGIYFAGEVLDVDGKCGGYNLQWAWASGYVAGSNAAKEERAGNIYDTDSSDKKQA